MTMSVFQLSSITLLFLSLSGCGGGGGESADNASLPTNSSENAAPQCIANSIDIPRGNGAVAVSGLLQCSDADGDALSYEPSTIQSDGLGSGAYAQTITISDGQGGQTQVELPYQITNQAPSCLQSSQPNVSLSQSSLIVSSYLSCNDSNGDSLIFTPQSIDTSEQAAGEYTQKISYSDGELSTTLDFKYTLSGDVQTELTRCELIRQSVAMSPENDVVVTCDDSYAYITSDTYPSHDLMNGIKATNEQIPVPALGYAAPIKLEPQPAANPTTIDAALGVAINGVPIYDYSAAGELDLFNHDPSVDTVALGQLDNCGGHAGRGDDYHYHAAPTCMMDAMETLNDDTIIGWGYDGYPLYGFNNPDGSAISQGDLELCNGIADDTFGYRYHLSTAPPYVLQCLVGEVDTRDLPRVAPLSGGADRSDLRPPAGDVQNLTHTVDADGKRTMRYDYQGENYYVTYSSSKDKANCYEFEMKAISNNGAIQTGTYCR
ncbi:YHYH protein [Pseudoalteromonas umbrosa]|uniref:YHYH protein n=1 Tax=Pseudoalteromonas umbrosa TaxID=3048489 RepID=UPI0024C2CF37|nr:YHYH protein [Pseudoalteromonas sp. B95]MDK1289853.1 YHYH protein [Pseudoalteromonas sp. B95]